jgi:hypothetical protein
MSGVKTSISNTTLIHAGVELVITAGLIFWVHSKTSNLQNQVTLLTEKINKYEEIINKQGEILTQHENALRQVYSVLQNNPNNTSRNSKDINTDNANNKNSNFKSYTSKSHSNVSRINPNENHKPQKYESSSRDRRQEGERKHDQPIHSKRIIKGGRSDINQTFNESLLPPVDARESFGSAASGREAMHQPEEDNLHSLTDEEYTEFEDDDLDSLLEEELDELNSLKDNKVIKCEGDVCFVNENPNFKKKI